MEEERRAWYTSFAHAPDFTIFHEFAFLGKFSVTLIVIASKMAECCSSTASFSDVLAYALAQLSEQFTKHRTCSFVYRWAMGNAFATKPFPM